jgi:hypothetical protein
MASTASVSLRQYFQLHFIALLKGKPRNVTGQVGSLIDKNRHRAVGRGIRHVYHHLFHDQRVADIAAVTKQDGLRFKLQDFDILKPLPSGILSRLQLVVGRQK